MIARIAVLGDEVLTKEAIMLALEHQLEFQRGFGRNWDALYDEFFSCYERDRKPIIIVVTSPPTEEARCLFEKLSEIVAAVVELDPEYDVRFYMDVRWGPIMEP